MRAIAVLLVTGLVAGVLCAETTQPSAKENDNDVIAIVLGKKITVNEKDKVVVSSGAVNDGELVSPPVSDTADPLVWVQEKKRESPSESELPEPSRVTESPPVTD